MKKLKKIESFGIEFSEEEIEKLGWKEGQKLFVTILDNGAIEISAGGEIELDLNDFDKETLMAMMKGMNELDLTFNEYVEKVFQEVLRDEA